jgi:hypothetical protein
VELKRLGTKEFDSKTEEHNSLIEEQHSSIEGFNEEGKSSTKVLVAWE